MSKRKQLTFMIAGTALLLFMVTFMWLNDTGYISLSAQEVTLGQEHIIGSSNMMITIKIFGLTTAGVAGGALIGAGVGSTVPGIGTGIGAFGGGIIGGMVGLSGSLVGS